MKILIFSQYFPPEPGAPSNRMRPIVDVLVKRGHEVSVICEFPNHPTGILARKDRWRFYRVKKNNSYRVIQTFVLTFARKNNIKRMLFYLSFSLSSFIAALLLKKHDVIFASSPPIFHVFSAMIAAKIKGSKFVLDVRDIWPDTAMEFKAVKNRRLLAWGGYLERKLYKNARAIFTISKGLKGTIESRGGAGKTSIIYNGTEEDILTWTGETNGIRESQGWIDKIIVCYAGLIGLGQNLVELLPEIELIEDNNIRFVFIGDGPGKNVLKDKTAKRNLTNVEFKNLMPRNQVIPYIHSSDIMLVILRESDFFKSAIPSKVFDYMAAGKPVVFNVDGELREILIDNDAGIYFSLRDKGSFGEAINRLKGDPLLRSLMGENGKKLVAEKFLRKNLAEKLAVEIENQTD